METIVFITALATIIILIITITGYHAILWASELSDQPAQLPEFGDLQPGYIIPGLELEYPVPESARPIAFLLWMLGLCITCCLSYTFGDMAMAIMLPSAIVGKVSTCKKQLDKTKNCRN